VGELGVIRLILDHAASVDEAIEILGSYNIDMGEVPIHYLVASASGESALVEFYQGEMHVFRSESPWQLATNFLVAGTDGQPQGQCLRYDHIAKRLEGAGGNLAVEEALELLSQVAQASTQWSIVYDMNAGEVHVVMGQKYSEVVHTLQLPGR
jgi:choloylglycine hydrolase